MHFKVLVEAVKIIINQNLIYDKILILYSYVFVYYKKLQLALYHCYKGLKSIKIKLLSLKDLSFIGQIKRSKVIDEVSQTKLSDLEWGCE